MNKVITIHLHGRAYQVEEPGFAKLNDYLEQAKRNLANDPDKDEIIADLEQSIGEKLSRFLAAGKTVALEKDVDEVIKEMGPVQSSSGGEQSEASGQASTAASAPKRLYRIPEGEMISGVCTGLAAYFNVDVTVVRLVFAILTILTHGAWGVVYLIMMFVVPRAKTSAEKAQAFGQPFTAQDLVDRARQEYNKFADKSEWKKWKSEMKQKLHEEHQKHRQERRQQWQMRCRHSPLSGFISACLSILWLLGIVQLIRHAAVFGFAVPAGIPLWVALLVWLCLYGFVITAINGYNYSVNYEYNGQQVHYHHHDGFFETVVWLAFIVLVVWFVWRYVPAAHPALLKAQLWGQHVWANLNR